MPMHQAVDICKVCISWQALPVHAGHHPAEDEQRGRSLRKIAKWVTRLLGTADLTPSDSALALVLVATLQRQARR